MRVRLLAEHCAAARRTWSSPASRADAAGVWLPSHAEYSGVWQTHLHLARASAPTERHYMKNRWLTASAALIVFTGGCALHRPYSNAAPAASPTPSAVERAQGGHPWSAGVEAKGSGPVHVGHPWTAQWNMPAPARSPIIQTFTPTPVPTATPAPAPAAAPPATSPITTRAPAREPPPARSKRTPRRTRG